MNFINYELSELDIIYILNCICLSINAITWNDCNMHNRRQAEVYFSFEPETYSNQLDNLIRLRDRISLHANKEIYNCINDNYFIGQRQYLISKKFDFLYNRRKFDKSIKIYIKNVNKPNKNIYKENKKPKMNIIKKLYISR